MVEPKPCQGGTDPRQCQKGRVGVRWVSPTAGYGCEEWGTRLAAATRPGELDASGDAVVAPRQESLGCAAAAQLLF